MDIVKPKVKMIGCGFTEDEIKANPSLHRKDLASRINRRATH